MTMAPRCNSVDGDHDLCFHTSLDKTDRKPNDFPNETNVPASSQLQALFEESILALQGVSTIMARQREEISKAGSRSVSTGIPIEQLGSQLKMVEEEAHTHTSKPLIETGAKEQPSLSLSLVEKELESLKTDLAQEKQLRVDLEQLIEDLRINVATVEQEKTELGQKLLSLKKTMQKDQEQRVVLESNITQLEETLQRRDARIEHLFTQTIPLKFNMVNAGVQCEDPGKESLAQQVKYWRKLCSRRDKEIEYLKDASIAQQVVLDAAKEAYGSSQGELEAAKRSYAEASGDLRKAKIQGKRDAELLTAYLNASKPTLVDAGVQHSPEIDFLKNRTHPLRENIIRKDEERGSVKAMIMKREQAHDSSESRSETEELKKHLRTLTSQVDSSTSLIKRNTELLRISEERKQRAEEREELLKRQNHLLNERIMCLERAAHGSQDGVARGQNSQIGVSRIIGTAFGMKRIHTTPPGGQNIANMALVPKEGMAGARESHSIGPIYETAPLNQSRPSSWTHPGSSGRSLLVPARTYYNAYARGFYPSQ